ncbi:hypothetical protein EYF80_059694 [Liparis tanakae]|uniref:Uncharacterized protein n=1 Tax=Liparis tanakae TaxID=230148 RepID=A0A4Z2ENX3_9TELE|nr:hypothetical protein EYF80_059694 [Liparis tanakae]
MTSAFRSAERWPRTRGEDDGGEEERGGRRRDGGEGRTTEERGGRRRGEDDAETKRSAPRIFYSVAAEYNS